MILPVYQSCQENWVLVSVLNQEKGMPIQGRVYRETTDFWFLSTVLCWLRSENGVEWLSSISKGGSESGPILIIDKTDETKGSSDTRYCFYSAWSCKQGVTEMIRIEANIPFIAPPMGHSRAQPDWSNEWIGRSGHGTLCAPGRLRTVAD